MNCLVSLCLVRSNWFFFFVSEMSTSKCLRGEDCMKLFSNINLKKKLSFVINGNIMQELKGKRRIRFSCTLQYAKEESCVLDKNTA